MAYAEALKTISRQAGADLTAAQYRFVKPNGSGGIVQASVAGEAVLGVLQNDPISGEAGCVAILGSSTKVVAGAEVAIDALVTTDNQGRAVTAATGNAIHGRALSGAGAAGTIITVLLQPGAAAVPA